MGMSTAVIDPLDQHTVDLEDMLAAMAAEDDQDEQGAEPSYLINRRAREARGWLKAMEAGVD